MQTQSIPKRPPQDRIQGRSDRLLHPGDFMLGCRKHRCRMQKCPMQAAKVVVHKSTVSTITYTRSQPRTVKFSDMRIARRSTHAYGCNIWVPQPVEWRYSYSYCMYSMEVESLWGISRVNTCLSTVTAWGRHAGTQAVDHPQPSTRTTTHGVHRTVHSAARACGPNMPSSRDAPAVDLHDGALFCDEDCRNQASCTLHLTVTNSICSPSGQGGWRPSICPPSQHPREPR